RITTSGDITEYPVPTVASFPADITTGPDGNLWFTEHATGKVGRFDPDTETFAEFDVGSASDSGPDPITTDGTFIYVGFQGDNGFAVLDLDGNTVESHELAF